MTIGQTEPVNIVYGNNLATKFDYDFYIETEEQLVVEHTNFSGVTTVLTYGVDYSIDGIGNEDGGQINFPLQGSTYQTLGWNESTDEKEMLVISLSLPFEQAAEFDISGDLNKKNLEKALDYQMRCTQILKRSNDRAMKVPEGTKINLSLPHPKANNTFAWNDDCSALINYDIIGENNSFKNQMSNSFSTTKQEFNLMIEANKQEILDLQQGYELELDTKFQTVSDAADKINSLEQAVENAETAAITASQKADEAAQVTAKATEDMQAQLNEATQELENKIAANDTQMLEVLNETENVLAQAENVLQETKDTLADTLNKTQITNCLSEVPQRINVEIVDGSVVLRAGSVVTVPNGPGVFDYVTVERDVSTGPVGTATNSTFWSYDKNTKTLRQSGDLNGVRSGDTDSLNGADGFWYNTSENRIYNYSAGATVASSLSFPFAIVHRTSGTWDKIEQTFNGIGCIGSTLWRGKDLKYLVPNGRNKDGSLKNIEVITSDTIVHNVDTANGTFRFMLLDNGRTFLPGESTFVNGTREFNAEENYYKQGETILNWCEVAHITASTTAPYRITSLKVKNAFSAADYNDVVTSRGDSEKLGCLTCTAHDVYALIAKSDIIDITQTPTANQYIGMDIRDKNNTRMAYLGVTNQANGNKFITLQNQGGTSGFEFPRCTTVPTTTSTASNRRVVVCTSNYRSGTSFIHTDSDGWCVQGGVLPSGANGWVTGTLLQGYNNTNYHIFINGRSASGSGNNATFQYECAAPASATTFSYYRIGYAQSWLAFGYIT